MNITLRNLNVWYSACHILKDVGVEFKSRQISAIIGPSGCGKTTLLKSINRTAELQPGFRCKGDILLAGIDLYRALDAVTARRSIAMVFQNPVALPMSIKENVLFGPRYYGIARTEAEAVAERCLREVALWDEVKDKLSSPASNLSGGQLQRLSIARVLALDPKAILFDEPCSSLDIRSIRQIEELLLKLADRVTVVIVTHNLQQARRIARDTALLLEGELVEFGETEKLLSQPQKERSKDFLFGQLG